MAPDSEANGGGVSDGSDAWGIGGVVGDGRYRMTYRLGRGGMAEVYAAEDVRLGRTVAVKLLRSDLAEDPVSKGPASRARHSPSPVSTTMRSSPCTTPARTSWAARPSRTS